MRALLFSGGLDSTALAYMLRPDVLVTIDYGQRCAEAEVRASRAISQEVNLPHEVIKADLSGLGCGPLSGKPPARGDFPPEWWPYRNQMLVTLTAMRFALNGLTEVIIGTVKGDDAHSDGRGPFIKAMHQLLQVQDPRVAFSAPASAMTAVELLRKAAIPDRILGWTFSCHVDSTGCGSCRGCNKHFETLADLQALATRG